MEEDKRCGVRALAEYLKCSHRSAWKIMQEMGKGGIAFKARSASHPRLCWHWFAVDVRRFMLTRGWTQKGRK